MILLFLAACSEVEAPPPSPPAPAEEPAPPAAAPAEGQRTTVIGVLVRRPLGVDDAQGTVLLLDDGTVVWLTYSDPPHGWEGLLDKRIQVEGTLWPGPPEDAPRTGVWMPDPHLTAFDAPVPAP